MFEKIWGKEKDKESGKEVKNVSPERELAEKYGVVRGIPEREVETESRVVKEKRVEESETKMSDLILRIEKIDGKLELLDDFRKDTSEKVTQLAEEIGELRSAMMEKEKAFSKIEVEMEKALELVKDVEPIKVKKEMEKLDEKILENAAKMESIESLVNELGKESKSFRDTMDSIKSFENLVRVAREIQTRIAKIDDTKKYVDALASKVESIFSDINVKLADFESQKEKITRLDELTMEMVKTLDDISLRLTKLAKADDLDKLRESIKSLESLNKTVGDMQVKVSKIEDTKKYDVLASKVESILSENKIRLESLERQKERIDKIDERISQLTKKLDEMNVKMANFTEKGIIKKLEDDLEKIKQMKGIEPLKEIQNLKLAIGEISNTLSELKFVELLNIIPYIRDQAMMSNCLSELDGIVNEMKQKNIWDEDKEKFLKNFMVSEEA